MLAVLGLSGYLGTQWIGSLEGAGFDRLFLILLTGCAIAIFLTALGFLRVWRRLRRIMEALDLEPIRFAFTALPAVSTWSPLWQPTARRRSYTVPARTMETVEKLRSICPLYYANLRRDSKDLGEKVTYVLKKVTWGEREKAGDVGEMNTSQNQVASKLADVLREGSWREGSSATLLKIKEGQEKRPPKPEQLPDTLAAEVVAIRWVALIRYVMLHLKNQLSFLTVGFILLAISLNCYSFDGMGFFRWWLTAIFVILSALTILTLVEMEHDATLSRLTDTRRDKVDASFYMKIVSAGALPLLAVISSQFPGIGRLLFSWLQPALSAMH
jgi:hypothetical protein